MEDRKIVRARRAAYLSIACAGLLLLPSCTAPVHVAWNRQQSVIEHRVPPPQGELDVYSESDVFYDGNVPRIRRRPVEVYSVDGRLIVSARARDGEGPIRFDLTPGHYIAAAESLRVPMPLASLLRDRFLTLLAQGGESLDWSAIGQLAAQDAGQVDRLR